tara:strand:- start:438 stop:1415 length:978 start_codon:yes stop_codon:yes gene_type:complete
MQPKIFTFNSNRSPILNSVKLQNYFKECLKNCKDEIIVCSAFITMKGIEWFYNNLQNKKINCRVISRWDRGDLLSKVSDIEVYNFCKKMGWSFEIIENLHAKFYLMDQKDLISGSLNLTAKGFGLVPISNKEFGNYFEAIDEDLININIFLEDAIKITDEKFNEYKKYLEENKDFVIQQLPELPEKIKNLKEKKLTKLWVHDFLFNEPENLLNNFNENTEDLIHDRSLLNINSQDDLSLETIKLNFVNLDLYKWFIKQIKNKNNKSFSFGELSALIHNSLFDDPKPYRKEIKNLQANFIKFLEILKFENIKIERPKYSQVISYID